MMNVEAARSFEMCTCTRLHGNTSQNTATIVYTILYGTVFKILNLMNIPVSGGSESLMLAGLSPGACLLYHRCSAGFPSTLSVCYLWQGYVCVKVRHRNNAATLYHLLGMHISRYCVCQCFYPQR